MKSLWDEATLAVRENMTVRQAYVISGKDDSCFTSYLHNNLTPPSLSSGWAVGKTGAFVEMGMLESTGDKGKDSAVMEAEGRKLAMHIVAMKPGYLDVDDVPAEKREEERKIFLDQLEEEEKASGKKGKPADIKEKIVKGKLGKWIKGIALMEQEHVANGEEGGVVGKVLKGKGVECRGFKLL